MAAVSLSVSSVTPLGDRVFVKVSASEEKTAGGILLPDTAKEKPQVGEVVAVGPGKRNDDGSRQAMEVNIGDKVLYSKYAGTDIKLGTDEYVLLSEKDILAVVSQQVESGKLKVGREVTPELDHKKTGKSKVKNCNLLTLQP